MCDAGEPLTLAALADRLGVRTPSLYNHIDGQDGLHRELTLYGSRELLDRITRAAVGVSGPEALIAVANAYRAFARQHPGVYAYTLRAPSPGDAEHVAAGEDAVGVLAAIFELMGLEPEEAIHAIRGFRSLIHGFVDLEMNGGFALPLDLDESYRRAVESYLTGIDAATE